MRSGVTAARAQPMIRIVAVTAVRQETRALLAALAGPRRRPGSSPTWEARAGANAVVVVEGGVGEAAARRTRAVLAIDACDVLVSFGFAGGLVPDAGPGTLVVADEVVWEEGGGRGFARYLVPEHLVRVLAASLPHALHRGSVRGRLLSSPVVLATPAAKAAAGARARAVAVEMETAALAALATERGAGLLPLRAILDPVDLSLAMLPPGLESSWRSRARAAARPRSWPLLAILRRDAKRSAAALRAVAAAVLPSLHRLA